MKVWYVHRRDDGSIASAHEERQEDYATEELTEGKSGDLDTFLAAARAPATDPVAAKLAEIDGKLVRLAKLETALVGKAVLTRADVDAAQIAAPEAAPVDTAPALGMAR